MPAVTTTSSALQATPRAWRRWSAISARRRWHAERRRRLRRDLERGRVAPGRSPGAGVDARGRRSAGQQVDARRVALGRPSRHCDVPRTAASRVRARAVTRSSRRFATDRSATGAAAPPPRELGDAGGRALAHLEVALARELFVGGDDRAARDAELRRERPRRRHGVAGAERSAEDAAAQPLDELHADRLPGVAVDDEDRAVHAHLPGFHWTAGNCENWTARRTSVLARLAA